LIITRSHIGYGAPTKQDTAAAHGSPLGEGEVEGAKKALGWPLEPTFLVPDDVLAHMRLSVDRGQAAEQEWTARFEAYRAEYPELAAEFEQRMRGELPEGWNADLPTFAGASKAIATRNASGEVINAIAPHLPALIGGAADLASSTKTLIGDEKHVSKDDFDARNIRFGVREHAMGGMLNGLALHGGFIPFGGTFLTFSDYMRPSVRLAALMDAHVIYVWTHDSVWLGEDGPTHQPVEHAAALRTIPNLTVIRPSDATETAEAWRYAVAHDGPVAMLFTRQGVPVIDRVKYAAASNLTKGAYVLADVDGTPDVILIATGSEVSLALEAREILAQEGVGARVVSMPSWELFEAQSQAYKESVLPPEVTARMAIEAGVSMGWDRYVGPQGVMYGIDHFGASAPYKVLMEQWGFTGPAIAKRALELLAE
jgi:transketolase